MNDIGNWKRMLLSDLPFEFLFEVVLRTSIMFLIILFTLRASGKRGIKQLSIFELVLIIGLGSAAGDPMFYDDVGILPAFIVFIVVISLYLSITKISDRFPWVEKILEGKPLCILDEGRIIIRSFKETSLSQDEVFAELRCRNVEHLGQVKTILIETSGEFSILFYADQDVKKGLPIFPDKLDSKAKTSDFAGDYACAACGEINYIPAHSVATCRHCSGKEWIRAIDSKRIA